MKHISQCWKKLENCKSYTEAKEIIENFPAKFGNWYVNGKADGGYTVMNVCEDVTGVNEEKVDFDWADIVLERDELIEETEDHIKVDWDVFDEFEEGMHIRILFSDDEDETVYEYKMISYDDDGIEMEYVEKF